MKTNLNTSFANTLFRRSTAALAFSSALTLPVAAQVIPPPGVQLNNGPIASTQHYDPATKQTYFWQAQVNTAGSLQISQSPNLTNSTMLFPALVDLNGSPFPLGVVCTPSGASKAQMPWKAALAQPILQAEDNNTADLFFAYNPNPSDPSKECIGIMRFIGNTWQAVAAATNVNPAITGFGAFTWDAVPEWPGEEAFVVYRDTNPTPTIAVVEMLPGTKPVGAILGGIHPPTGVTGWDGNVSACLSTNTVNPTPDAPKLLWVSLSCDQGVYVGRARFGAKNTAGQGRSIQDSDMTWTLVPVSSKQLWKGRTTANMPAQNLHLGADGGVYLTSIDLTGEGVLIYKINTDPTTPWILFTTDKVRHSAGSNPYSAAPTTLYTYNPPTTATDNSTKVGVNRVLLSRSFAQFGKAAGWYQSEVNPFGAAQRLPIDKIPHNDTMQSVLVGVIDGPPPVPNENLVNVPSGAVTLGYTQFGQTVGQSTDTNYSTSLELIAKAKAKAGGFFASVSTEAELDLGGDVKWGNSTESSLMTSYKTAAQPIKEDGAWKVLRNGTAFLYETSYTGFTYQFLDPSGNVVPDAPQYLQLIPTDSHMTAYPFAYDPNATSGIIPGELQSYLMPQSDRLNLEQNSSYTFGNGNDISYSWAEGGSRGEEFDQISSHYLGGGVDVNLEVLLGGKTDVGFFEGEVQGGFDFKFNWDTNTTDSVKNQIGTEVDFPPAPEDAGVYERYTYHLLNLKENNAYCQELLNLLRSYNDPAGNNLNLLKRIVPSSAPWKITYAIDQFGDGAGDFYQIPPSLGAAAAQVAPIPASLKAKGITSQKQIAQLHGALLQGNKRIVAGRPGALPAEVHAKLATLTSQERSDLANYVKALQANSEKQFRMRHPNWKPRTFPDPKTNLPSFYGKRPARGTITATATPRLSPLWQPGPGMPIKR